MRILAIETSETAGSVAALIDDKAIGQLDLPRTLGSAKTLAPTIQAVLAKAGWRPPEVELVAVTVGPGSFTGLRVGVTTAKVFAYCVGAEILGLDTLDVIAAAAPAEISRVSVAVDAQRGQVVAATFARGKDGSFLPVEPSQRVDVSRWLSNVQSGVFFSGPVLRKLSGRVPEGVLLLREEHWSPTAVALGRLAARQYAAGRRDDVWSLVPRYSRKSAAEEKWEAKSTGPDYS